MDFKNPQNTIWLIPIVSFLINLLSKFTLGITDKWIFFGIYIAGFILIGYLADVYKKQKANDEAIKFFNTMVTEGKIDSNTREVTKSVLAHMK